MITEFVVTSGETRKRLDMFLVYREPKVSRSNLQRLIELGRIRLNAQVVKPGQRIKPGDRITMDVPQPSALAIDGTPISLEILHEDETHLVLNKPGGIVVHPAAGNWTGTVVNALLRHFEHEEKVERSVQKRVHLGLVHRLDKGTSGLMVIAKTDQAHRALATQFQQHTIQRVYDALVWGTPQHAYGIVEFAIGRDSNNKKTYSASTSNPKKAITKYRVAERLGTIAAHVILHPRSGRTHQLRVHLASLGIPILGDEVYGGEKVRRVAGMKILRPMLHARTLGFHHPVSGAFQEYTVDLPDDMQILKRTLRRQSESWQSPSHH